MDLKSGLSSGRKLKGKFFIRHNRKMTWRTAMHTAQQPATVQPPFTIHKYCAEGHSDHWQCTKNIAHTLLPTGKVRFTYLGKKGTPSTVDLYRTVAFRIVKMRKSSERLTEQVYRQTDGLTEGCN